MSLLEENKVTPSKALTGGGDGVLRIDSGKCLRTRAPVPSCRRFAARQEKKDIRQKLEKALQEFKTPPAKLTKRPRLLRRSVSMAEITPTRSTSKKK